MANFNDQNKTLQLVKFILENQKVDLERYHEFIELNISISFLLTFFSFFTFFPMYKNKYLKN
ncbi:hypothetical protein BpHYR1_047944 [Brachionus plicatilis]|uniref:Uncharacterized protein n=1 Tax=Brachionus plicatilis TaxID=10195 RepID=A0A3M7S0M4_BRAPC|nr:hypothetical protein BpHYR1_047944 [Brachionus plicatilis]